jgi:hypothetical protein
MYRRFVFFQVLAAATALLAHPNHSIAQPDKASMSNRGSYKRYRPREFVDTASRRVLGEYSEPSASPFSAAFSPDGTRVVTGGGVTVPLTCGRPQIRSGSARTAPAMSGMINFSVERQTHHASLSFSLGGDI